MRIAIDLDGVMYEWQRTWRYMMSEYLGVEFPEGPIDQWWTTWDAHKLYGSKRQHAWMWTDGVKLGLFRYGHMVKGTRVALQELSRRKHQLEIVTHRPAQAVNDTLDWVALHFKDIPLHGLTILSNGEPKSQSQADILIDDKIENVVEWASTSRKAILFSRPYNEKYQLPAIVTRAYGWKGVVNALV